MAVLTYSLPTGYEAMKMWDSKGSLELTGAEYIRVGNPGPEWPNLKPKLTVRDPVGDIYVTDVDNTGITLSTAWKTFSIPVTAINGHTTKMVTDWLWNRVNVGLAAGGLGLTVGAITGYLVKPKKLTPVLVGAALGGGLGYGVGYVVAAKS